MPLQLGTLHERLPTLRADMDARSVGVEVFSHRGVVLEALAAALRGANVVFRLVAVLRLWLQQARSATDKTEKKPVKCQFKNRKKGSKIMCKKVHVHHGNGRIRLCVRSVGDHLAQQLLRFKFLLHAPDQLAFRVGGGHILADLHRHDVR